MTASAAGIYGNFGQANYSAGECDTKTVLTRKQWICQCMCGVW